VRKFLYNLTVHNKEIGLGTETNFDFKYVPQLGQMTELGQPDGSRLRVGTPERQGLTALMLAAVLVAAVAWSGFRAASAMKAVSCTGDFVMPASLT
jgi:hypothetical protein